MSDPARVFFRDAGYDGQLARSLSAAYVHAADLGEVLATARGIAKPSPERWYAGWLARADAVRAAAQQAREAGDVVGARQAGLRASEYYRQAFYYLRRDPSGARLLAAHAAHVDTFVEALPLLDVHAEQVRIPYDRTTLKAYFFAPDASRAARPTVLLPCGYDSTAEAGWMDVPGALQRGYNALTFEGPGQGEALYRQQLYFRPDFEQVLSPVVDWLLARPEVDRSKLILMGRSFAGYLAPRAATAEHRIAALICDPAQPVMSERLPKGWLRRIAVPAVRLQMGLSPSRAEFFGARMAAHGLADIGSYFAELEKFDMLERAGQIRCPTLIVESEHDFAGGSGQAFLEALKCPAKLVRLTAAEGADGHCAGLGQQLWEQAVYGWLAQTLAKLSPDRAAT